MAKGVLFIAVAICLVASSYQQGLDLGGLLKPLTGVLETVTGAVGGVASGLTNALGGVTNALGGVTDTLSGLLKGVLDTVLKLVETLLKVVTELLKVIVNLLQSLLQVPLQAVNQLLDALNGLLKPSLVKVLIKNAMNIQISAGNELASQLAGTAAVTKCLINQVSANITAEVLKSTVEIISCAKPLFKDVKDAAKLVENTVAGSGEFVDQMTDELGKCLKANANSADPSKIFGCLADPVSKGMIGATLFVSSTTPIINSALRNALGITGCANIALNKQIGNANGLLEGVVKCAAKLGVNASLPRLPGGAPNFTAIAERALSTIQDLSTGAQNPITDLTAAIKKLQASVASTSPFAVQTSVNKSIAGIQAALDSIRLNPNVTFAPPDPPLLQCIYNAQNNLDTFASQALELFLECSSDIGKDAAGLVKQAAELDVGLKADALKAGVNAFAKCSQFALNVDTAAQNCFDAAVNEVRNSFNAQLKQVNVAIAEAYVLINKTEGCLVKVQETVDAKGQELIRSTKQCVANRGVVIAPQDLQTSITVGENLIFKSVSSLNGVVLVADANNENVKGAIEFIQSIDSELLSSIISPTVLTGKLAVSQTREALKNNTNPAVKACLDASEARLSPIESAALVSAQACIQSNLAAAKGLASKSEEGLASLKKRLDNAVADAVALCSKSVSAAAADNCFANFNQTLNVEVKNAQLRSGNLADEAQLALNNAVACTNDVSNDAAVKVDAELASLKSCLAVQGVTIFISRS